MAMPASAPRFWTPSDVLAELPESTSTHYECLDGELVVTPVPRVAHELAVDDLRARLAAVVGRRRTVQGLADLRLTTDSLVQPDLFVLEAPLRGDMRWEDVARPLLIVEVLSPSTARIDRGTKRRLYQQAGVPEYWIVDLAERLIERWTPGATTPDRLQQTLAWADPVTGQRAEFDLPAFFSAVLDEHRDQPA
jgi:Uma2 family endonuclease